MTSEVDRLLSDGMPIELADGEEVSLRFTLRALARCEQRYGNLHGTLGELRWLVEQVALGYPEPVSDRLSLMLQAVLDAPAPVDAVSSHTWCIEALMDAWLEAFPPPSDAEGKAPAATTSAGRPGGVSPSSTAV